MTDAPDQPRSLPDAPLAGGRRELPTVHTSLSAPPTRLMRRRKARVGMVTRDEESDPSKPDEVT